jgi:predicted nucleic acid-binding Zn ribbon protein
MDPVTAMATASAAFGALKKGFQIGRDIESMVGDLSRWMGALSDIEQAEKEAKNPPIFKKMFAGKSVEQEALEVVMHKRKVQEQRDQLRQLIQYTCKAGTWEELIRMEGKIRKERQETLYRQRERRRKFVEIVALVGLFIAVVVFVAFVIWLYINR